MAATISTRLTGLGTSRDPMNYNANKYEFVKIKKLKIKNLLIEIGNKTLANTYYKNIFVDTRQEFKT